MRHLMIVGVSILALSATALSATALRTERAASGLSCCSSGSDCGSGYQCRADGDPCSDDSKGFCVPDGN